MFPCISLKRDYLSPTLVPLVYVHCERDLKFKAGTLLGSLLHSRFPFIITIIIIIIIIINYYFLDISRMHVGD